MQLVITDHAHERMCRRKIKKGWVKRAILNGRDVSMDQRRSGKQVKTNRGELTVVFTKNKNEYTIVTVWIDDGRFI